MYINKGSRWAQHIVCVLHFALPTYLHLNIKSLIEKEHTLSGWNALGMFLVVTTLLVAYSIQYQCIHILLCRRKV